MRPFPALLMPRYLDQNRDDRLNPPRGHGRYHVHHQLRRRLEEAAADAELPLRGDLLDYGCGSMPYRPILEPRVARYVGADLPGNDAAGIDLLRDGELPPDVPLFDVVLSTQVLEHVVDPRLYLTECRRALKPGGLLLLSTHGLWMYHPDPTDFWRWTLDGLKLEIERQGFEVRKVRQVLSNHSALIQLWQDETANRLPGLPRGLYIRAMQSLIGLLVRKHNRRVTPGGCIYLMTAVRSEGSGNGDE